MERQRMKMELQKCLEKKRFFIVLDDFADNNLNTSLARELIDMGHKGSAIIVTTRSRRVASLIGTTPAYQLHPLSSDASSILFMKYAGIDVQIGLPDQQHKTVAMKLLKLCGGVPLFIKLVGAPLRLKKGYIEWGDSLENLLENGFASTKHLLPHNVIPTTLSYLKLLLESFILQKACGLSVEALICAWMALGFLYSDAPTQQPESIGRKYLIELVNSPLCPDVEYAPGGLVRHIKFNDALCELITSIEHQKWFSPRGKYHKDPQEFARYMIWGEDYLPDSTMPSKVCLFILCRRGQASAELVRDIVSSFKSLRLLGFGRCDIQMLPDSIGQLKHLRYLDVARNYNLKTLPDSICNLWHLQTLLLHGCSQLQVLPANIWRLQNLRYLTLTILEQSLPEAIGQLTSLRTLALASCPRLASLPSSLNNLKNLETLGIVGCQELDLHSKSSVEGLKGMDAMHTLLLSHLPKFASLPSNLGNLSVAIQHLLIQSCPSLAEITWIAQFRSLHSLTIEDCPQLPTNSMLAYATSQLNGLLELVVRRCPSLVFTAWIRQFMSLRSLIIDGCPNLVKLDAAFSELKKLERVEVRRCPRLTEWFASPAGKVWGHIVRVRVIELDGVRLES